jgi:hypothetical protein
MDFDLLPSVSLRPRSLNALVAPNGMVRPGFESQPEPAAFQGPLHLRALLLSTLPTWLQVRYLGQDFSILRRIRFKSYQYYFLIFLPIIIISNPLYSQVEKENIRCKTLLLTFSIMGWAETL